MKNVINEKLRKATRANTRRLRMTKIMTLAARFLFGLRKFQAIQFCYTEFTINLGMQLLPNFCSCVKSILNYLEHS
jgi:hypothetical protein